MISVQHTFNLMFLNQYETIDKALRSYKLPESFRTTYYDLEPLDKTSNCDGGISVLLKAVSSSKYRATFVKRPHSLSPTLYS